MGVQAAPRRLLKASDAGRAERRGGIDNQGRKLLERDGDDDRIGTPARLMTHEIAKPTQNP